ncbi:MAG: hypothetical protein ACTHMY_08610 [Solirubrobacteraceae bacterium]
MHAARETLEASISDGRVLSSARNREGVSAIALSDESIARIQALERHAPALLEVRSDDGAEARIWIIDDAEGEQVGTDLRCSENITLAFRQPRRSQSDLVRIPELERELVAAVRRMPRWRAGSLVALCAIVVFAALGALAYVDSGQRAVPSTAIAVAQGPSLNPDRDQIARAANAWVHKVAGSVQKEMGGVRESSFRRATLDYIVIDGRRGLVAFSNGAILKLTKAAGPKGMWRVDQLEQRRMSTVRR